MLVRSWADVLRVVGVVMMALVGASRAANAQCVADRSSFAVAAFGVLWPAAGNGGVRGQIEYAELGGQLITAVGSERVWYNEQRTHGGDVTRHITIHDASFSGALRKKYPVPHIALHVGAGDADGQAGWTFGASAGMTFQLNRAELVVDAVSRRVTRFDATMHVLRIGMRFPRPRRCG